MEQKIHEEICHYVAGSPANRFPGSSEPIFDDPLIGIVACNDPLLADFKNIIGNHHLTPMELVASSPEGGAWSPNSVISWVLPISRKTREVNRQASCWPSLEWVLTANLGSIFLAQLRAHVAEFIRSRGHRALAPHSTSVRAEIDGLDVPISANWSERHIAYAAGLGTFSLNAGLITSKGIAHRCGSILTELSLTPTPRTYPDHLHYCLFYREGTCGKCIDRCPSGALSRNGNNKVKCFMHIYRRAPSVLMEKYGLAPEACRIGSCGLCQTKVPCEACIPAGKEG